MNIDEYFEKCKNFDWFFSYSDDNRVYSSGKINQTILRNLFSINPIFQRVYNDWEKYSYSGKPWGTEKLPEPKLEDYIDKNISI